MKDKGHKQNLYKNDIHITNTHIYVVEAKEDEKRVNPGISNQ